MTMPIDNSITRNLIGATWLVRWAAGLALGFLFALASVCAQTPAATTTTLASSINPSVLGQATALTATVLPSTATGTVTFKDGGIAVGTVALSGGRATLNGSFASVGVHNLTAVYGGATGYATSTSAVLVQTVNPVPGATSTALSSSINPTTIGQATVLTASLTPATATGTVIFKDGATTLGTAILSAGKASFNASFATAGAHSLTAVYGGATGFASSTSAALAQTVNPATAASSTVLTSSINPATVGQATVLTASVTPATATGTVTFKDGATTLGTATLSAGKATLIASFAIAGAHSLTAVYGGGTGFASSTSAALAQTVNTAAAVATGTALTSSLNPTTVGQATVLTATVSPNTATGTVTFKDGATTLGTSTLSAGKATLSASFATAGAHSVTAVYGGATGFASSTSAALAQTVNPATAATSTALTSSVNPTTVGQATVLTATVSPNTATGTVTFKDGATTLGTATLSAGGKATFSASFATAGAHSLTAVYGGGTGFASSISATLAQTVSPATSATSTALSSSINPSSVGQATALTATITPSTATGTITFKDGATTLGTANLSAGKATLSTSFATAGAHSLTAVYGGATGFASSTSAALAQTVNPATAATTTALNSSVNPSAVGQATVLTATIAPSTATGTITFKDGATTLGTATLSAGKATLSTGFTTAGSHSLSAVYGGATGFASSTSAALAQTVNPVTAATTTALNSSVNPSAVGQATVLTAAVTPSTATGTVTFKDGTTTLGTATLNAGKATFSASFATAGAHSLTAVYSGVTGFASSTSVALVQTVGASVALPAAPLSPAPVTTYVFDANGYLRDATVAPGTLNLTTSTGYDALNRPVEVRDPSGATTQLAYDAQSKLTRLTDPKGLATQTPRDGFGQPQQLQSPDTGTTAYGYDAAGNLSQRTDSRGVLASYTYDPLNRLSSATYSQAGQTSRAYNWTYDQTGTAYGAGIGRLTTATFPEGNTRYTYNTQGRVTQATQTLNPTAGANPATLIHTTSYNYDSAGRLASTTYPSGRQIVLSYANGLPTSLSLAATAGATAVPLLTQIQHTPFGPPQSWNWAQRLGPLAHTRQRDSSARLVRYPLGNILRDLRYDAASRITSYTHYSTTPGSASATPAPSLDQQFSYDPLGRLTQASTASRRWAFTYDANGNRTSVAVDGASPAPYTVEPTSNRITALSNPSLTLRYDPAGNTVSDGTFTLGYDLRGRLSTATSAGTAHTYTYDNAGQRVRKVSSAGAGSTVVFAYGLNNELLGEYDANGKALREYVWLGDIPVAMLTPDPAHAANAPLVFYIHADHLNTPRALLDQDGKLRWSWFAEPFGTTQAESNPSGLGAITFSLRFPGQVYDAETGMHYNLNRDYIPGLGRYAQSDPIGLDGGINTFAYVDGNPLSFADPLGLQAYNGQTPPSSVPGGPWTPAGAGQPPGTFYGPKQPNGPRTECRYVPDEANGGPPGAKDSYWKTKEPGKPWTRFDQNGNPISPEEAHPGNPPGSRAVSPLGVPGWMPLYPFVCPLCNVLMPPTNRPS